jgi:soluble lytic murein transglycosylase-like protein
MVLGASTFFVPHAAKSQPPRATPLASPVAAATLAAVPVVTVSTEFRLAPQWAYESLIQEAALRHHLDPALIRAVIAAESAFDANAVSDAGAQGLMQLMPALAAEMGVDDVFDPRQNIMGGVRYLRQLVDAYDGNLDLALASYNAGPGTVQLYGGIPPFRETQQYVKTITDALARSQTAAAEPD